MVSTSFYPDHLAILDRLCFTFNLNRSIALQQLLVLTDRTGYATRSLRRQLRSHGE